MRSSLLPLFAALTLSPAIAFAAPPQTVTVRIPHGDLDLSTSKGFEKLEKRIKLAAVRACRNPAPLTGALVVDETCLANATGAALAIARRRAPAQVAVGN